MIIIFFIFFILPFTLIYNITFQQPESSFSTRELIQNRNVNSNGLTLESLKFWDITFWKNIQTKFFNFFIEIRKSIENLSFASILHQFKCSLLFGIPITVICFGLFFGLYFAFSTARIPLEEFSLDVLQDSEFVIFFHSNLAKQKRNLFRNTLGFNCSCIFHDFYFNWLGISSFIWYLWFPITFM